ncbi:RNA polymerase sigma factor [Sphingobacterium sp. UDSM-2020]|uniref:RNA polymerase sigma factor n=1 Tax=Sphingobacterium sp. UDSM-2020 TaxID=2795738 RepID=UPI001937A3BE|nr:sigma-70 family RNA polymerase sigma factor [Sphingobacterium sp. UDSM-2020]QQD11902.1 sigma-70 family RNA polymerase sigma factor [Sphingobacterium sp. UDSM-2020]
MNKTLQIQQAEKYISFLQNGDERGLNFFYNRFYGYLFASTFRATKDDCAAESIAQEALLRLWLYRKQVKDIDDTLTFLKAQVKSAIHAFYNTTRDRFHRNLLRLDGIENYQEFLMGYEMEEEEEMDLIYMEKLEEEKQERLDKLNKLLPSLNNQQQLFIKLCLKYSFNYERIAYYLGGISDYEVSLQVEKTIDTLRSVFNSSQQMELLNKPSKIVLQGEFNDQQPEIFHMRYELQFSFEQISEALKLNPSLVKQLFVQAHAKIKTAKKTA